MVVQQKDQESLQQRVNEFLRGHSTAYVVEEVGERKKNDKPGPETSPLA